MRELSRAQQPNANAPAGADAYAGPCCGRDRAADEGRARRQDAARRLRHRTTARARAQTRVARKWRSLRGVGESGKRLGSRAPQLKTFGTPFSYSRSGWSLSPLGHFSTDSNSTREVWYPLVRDADN